MKKSFALYGLVAVVLVAVPATGPAQTNETDATNAPVAPAAPAPGSRNIRVQFGGKVTAVDAVAMTFTVGAVTYNVTSATRISKEGQPGMFADIIVGKAVRGAYKTGADGKLNVTSIRVGDKGSKDLKNPADVDRTIQPGELTGLPDCYFFRHQLVMRLGCWPASG